MHDDVEASKDLWIVERNYTSEKTNRQASDSPFLARLQLNRDNQDWTEEINHR